MAVRKLEPPVAAVNLSVEEAATVVGLGRTLIYRAIAEKKIKALKFGRRTLVPRVEAERFARSLDGDAA